MAGVMVRLPKVPAVVEASLFKVNRTGPKIHEKVAINLTMGRWS
jgi:hypothetical protein